MNSDEYEIAKRCFIAIDLIIDAGLLFSREHFYKMYKLSRRKYIDLREYLFNDKPCRYTSVDVVVPLYLMRDFGIPCKWLFFGGEEPRLMKKELLTANELKERLSLPMTGVALRKMANAGILPHVKHGKFLYYSEEDFKKWYNKNKDVMQNWNALPTKQRSVFISSGSLER